MGLRAWKDEMVLGKCGSEHTSGRKDGGRKDGGQEGVIQRPEVHFNLIPTIFGSLTWAPIFPSEF